jgi:aldehyde dehydrogenase (NAD+)
VAPGSDERIEVVDPATEEVVAAVPAGVPADVDRAVAAARAAFPGWAATDPTQRAALLDRVADALTAGSDAVAHTISREMGAPLKLAVQVQTGLPIRVLRGYAALLRDFAWTEEIGNSLVVREPVGVLGAITPWNYPLHQVVAKLAPALAAGCTVVLKPSEVAPLSAYVLMEILSEVGLPPGVVNLVPGTGAVVGEAIARHPDVDMVSFTGSTRAGKRVMALAAESVKKVALELGGKSANVLLPDVTADLLGRAVKVGVANAFLNSGQTCTAWSRLLVHRDAYEEAVQLAAQAAEAHVVGHPLAEGTRLGPLASAGQRDRVCGYIEQGLAEGAHLIVGGTEPRTGLERGYYVLPTVFAEVRPEMAIAREEIFGPVLSVLSYADEDEALAIANGTVYGLAGGVWSAERDRAVAFARRLRTGQVDINGGRFNPLAPFGGYKQSGIGRELGRHGLEEVTEVKALQL